MSPNYSVLISVYYKEKPIYLKSALDSVLNQTLPPSEIILIKDGPLTVELEEEDPIFPHVSDLEDIELAEDEIVRNISVNIRFYEGWDE